MPPELTTQTETQAIQNLRMMKEWALDHAPELIAMLDEAIEREIVHGRPQ